MKISKLFHWLYAFLMLLPVFFIGGRCLYVTFNKNAKDSYSGESVYEINYKYESNEVNTFNDVLVNHIYQLNYLTLEDFTQYEVTFEFEILSGAIGVTSYDYTDIYADDLLFYYSGGCNLTLNYYYFTESYFTYTNGIIYEGNISDYYAEDLIVYIYYIEFDIGDELFGDYTSQLFSYTDYNVIDSVTIDNSGTLDNAFIYSVNSLNDVPLFSWAKTSFLVAPFSYISGLFGIESTSPINTMLSYWLAISIIWLVFDLIMYVPLLVHRWIDKAKLE